MGRVVNERYVIVTKIKKENNEIKVVWNHAEMVKEDKEEHKKSDI